MDEKNKNNGMNQKAAPETRTRRTRSEEDPLAPLTEEEMRRRRAARLERIRRRRKRAIRNRIILGCSVLCFLAVIVGVSSWLIGRKKGGESDRGEITDMQQANAGGGNQAEGSGSADRKEGDGNSGTEGTAGEETPLSVLDQARLLAAQYDYDKAIDLLKNDAEYGKNQDMQAAVQKFEETKASCKLWPAEEVTHVFYHSLVVDTSKAFDGDAAADGYNQVMTTIDEFNKITPEHV